MQLSRASARTAAVCLILAGCAHAPDVVVAERAPAVAARDGEWPSLERMAAEADAVVVGRVVAVAPLGTTRVSRATVRVDEWLLGGPAELAYVTFDDDAPVHFDIAAPTPPDERVLFFLRRRLSGSPLPPSVLAVAPAPDPAQDWALQCTELRAVRCAFRVEASGRLRGPRDSNPNRLASARAVIVAHAAPPPYRGVRALLWAEKSVADWRETVALHLLVRNVGSTAAVIATDPKPGRVAVEIIETADAMRRIRVDVGAPPADPKAPRVAASGPVRIAPGAETLLTFSVAVGLALRPDIADERTGWTYDGTPCFGGLVPLGADHGGESVLLRAVFDTVESNTVEIALRDRVSY